MTRTELAARFAGSLLGRTWLLLSPLFLLGTYAAVYLYIFRIQAPGLSPSRYVLYLFAGLVPYLMTAEAVSLGVGSVVANKAVLSNTVFPIDLAPAKAVLLSQTSMAVGVAVILIASAFLGALSWTAALVPLIWGLHLVALTGLVWILSLINLVFRDLQNLVGVIMIVVMIASPIAYTPEMVPAAFRPLLLANPLAYFITSYQRVLVLGMPPGVKISFVLLAMSAGLFMLGGHFFGRGKRALIDYV